jgi:hypothetical protein
MVWVQLTSSSCAIFIGALLIVLRCNVPLGNLGNAGSIIDQLYNLRSVSGIKGKAGVSRTKLCVSQAVGAVNFNSVATPTSKILEFPSEQTPLRRVLLLHPSTSSGSPADRWGPIDPRRYLEGHS